MNLDPELAKKVLKVYSSSFKKILDEHSSYGMLGDFDPPTATQIHLNLDRYHGADDATREGLLLNFLLSAIIHLFRQSRKQKFQENENFHFISFYIENK